MPLQIITSPPNKPLATQVYRSGRDVNKSCRYKIDMGGFVAVRNTQKDTAIGTEGAGTCHIIVVHKARGCGALGHYPGTLETKLLVAGVQQMVRSLGGGQVEEVVFAAGMGGDDKTQTKNESELKEKLSALYPSASVVWEKSPGEFEFGCCYYLPLREQLALLDEEPGNFEGSGDLQSGLKIEKYTDPSSWR